VQYQIVAEAYRDLEVATGRLALIDRLAALLGQTPAELLPTVCYLCQGLIAPEFAGVELGVAEKLAARAVATAAGVGAEQVRASLRETGDLGQAAEQLLAEAADGRPPSLQVAVVVDTLHQIAAAEGQGSQARKLELLGWLLQQATPLEARYLLRLVTGTLRLGVGTPTILDALAAVHAGGRKDRPVLERAYNICCDLGLVAATLVKGGLAAVEQLQVRPGNPVRPMLAQRLSSTAEILAKLGACAAEYKYDGIRVQAHRTTDGSVELYTRRLDRVSTQFPEVVKLLDQSLQPREAIPGGRGGRVRPGLRGAAPLPGGDVPPAQVRASPRRSATTPSACSASSCCTPTAPTSPACRTWTGAQRWPRPSARRRGCGWPLPNRSATKLGWSGCSSRPWPRAAKG
jgi:DNA ligase 1